MAQRGLSKKHRSVHRFVQGHNEAKGYGPSFAEIGAACRVKGKGQVSRLLDDLEAEALVRRRFARVRSIEIIEPIAIPRAPDGAPLFFVRIEEAQ